MSCWIYWRITQGSITDVVTLKRIIEYNKAIGLKEDILYIVDKGFLVGKISKKSLKIRML